MTEANLIKLDTKLGEILQTRNSAYGAALVGGRPGNSRGSQFMGESGRHSPEQDYYGTVDSRGSKRNGILSATQALKPVSQASQRSRSSAIKDVGNQILQSPTVGAHNSPNKDGDYWTKIILHNAEQFQREKDAVKAKIRENQIKMREELQKQMEEHRMAKQDAKKTDLEYFEIIRRQKEEQAFEEKEKREQIKRLVQEQKLIRDKQIEEHNH